MKTALQTIDVEQWIEDAPCDLCSHKNEEYLFDRKGVLTGYVFRVVRCRDCGLIYLNPRLNERGLSLLYDDQYYRGEGFDPQVDYLPDVAEDPQQGAWLGAQEHVESLKEIRSPPARILDFGCGTGSLVRLAKIAGYDVDGLETSPFAAGYVERLGLRVFRNTNDLPCGYYDVVTAIEVLEHCPSATRVLAAIHRCLKPGGIFYYTTANFDGYVRRLRQGMPPADLDGYILPEGHICFFSTRTMRRYIQKTGFSRMASYFAGRYERGSRVYKTLRRWRLASEGAEKPETPVQKLAHFVAQRGAGLCGLRRRFPLAIK